MWQRPSKPVLIFLSILVVFFLWFSISWLYFIYKPMLAANKSPIIIEVQPGTPIIAVAVQLKQQGLLNKSYRFVWLARFHGALSKIKAGEYLIEPGKTTAAQLLNNMIAGKVFLRQLTIIEGWTFKQLMDAVNNNPYLQHTLTGYDNATIMTKLGYPNVSPEGFFYPNTYLFSKGTADSKILKKAARTMQNLLINNWNKRAVGLPYENAYQALTAASLIEKETSLINERPVIAGVIVRRLQRHMLLQIDPTVIYGLGPAYHGKLSFQDLKIISPYNTYLHAGLPPTPIAMPSSTSIYAALHPAPGNVLYYVATGNGGHVFSTTLEQQDAAIRQYRLKQAQTRILTPTVSKGLLYCPMPAKITE